MMVTFVSQCEKKALKRTRRVLDAFANRIGDNTWQTVITEDGLLTVKKMLRQTASKSTAVSCHWIRSRSRSQFLWVVGNRRKFSVDGYVAVNSTALDINSIKEGSGWEWLDLIKFASGIAGLFHDFGKANDLFQQKLKGQTAEKSEPFRHEWVSLRIFEEFAKEKTDPVWLKELAEINQAENGREAEQRVQETLKENQRDLRSPFKSFDNEATLAKLVAWLIVSHHRLPYPQTKAGVNIEQADKWLKHCFNYNWNSKNAENINEIPADIVEKNWSFSLNTPFISKTWQSKASEIALKTLKCPYINSKQDWLSQRFVSHLSRLSLMLADHYYSSLDIEESKVRWRDEQYKASANTDKKTGQLKQKLDEHNIGVANNAFLFAKNLPVLKETLPTLLQHRVFSQSATQKKYQWQDKAFKAAKLFSKASEKQGFFGVNMASTGCGKTMANARIMYALANERDGCRFSVALGLRTLTLQTGDAYKGLLELTDEDLAVLIGSNAVKQLHELKSSNFKRLDSGSESANDFLEELYVSYAGMIYDGRLKRWLAGNPKLEKLISAPVLVSTIDHLMPATESKRGGKQIAPMLRLLTSDLVLDEPDDFGLEDLPALCRLVNWAGMLGSRVLLSSATLPPSLIRSLYSAYAAGRAHYNEANFSTEHDKKVVCGWFDEHKSHVSEVNDSDAFKLENQNFVEDRLNRLAKKAKILRKGEIVEINDFHDEGGSALEIREKSVDLMAKEIHAQIHTLHERHQVSHKSGKRISLGVVRIANINPLVAIAKQLLATSPQHNFKFHFCVYHSQFPLALRSLKENRLDQTLTRYKEDNLWQQKEIKKAINESKEKNLVFIVLGTSVVEVGRDHDYDWAIAEPSSLRSIIQLAGRVQRHRQQEQDSANVVVLNKNMRGLQNSTLSYCKPGFETKELSLSEHGLNSLLDGELDNISSIPRILEPKMMASYFIRSNENGNQANPVSSLAVQEHRALRLALEKMGKDKENKFFNLEYYASIWWENESPIDWSAEFVSKTEFRKSAPQQEYILLYKDSEELVWSQVDKTQWPYKYEVSQNGLFESDNVVLADGNCWWFDKSPETIYCDYAQQLDMSAEQVSRNFGTIGLREYKDQTIDWRWHNQLGVYENY